MKQPIPFGNYYLMDLIAKGGMAEVFKAKYLGPEGFSKVVAVKRILPELSEEQDFIRMFIDEAKIASQLNHANVATILQLGEAQGTYFIAMEFIQGKDVRTIYERSRRDTGVPPTPQMAAFIISQVCEGLDYAHRRRGDTGKHLGIIHRDISPQNVIVSFDGNVKLIDFGIAKAQDKLVKTEAGILKGKYCYMSPEQVRGLSIDHRSDVFGLGVVLHEILTRQRLFLGSNDLKTLENVLQQDIPTPSSINPAVPPELDAITMKALSRDVNTRFQFASDMHEELQRFLYTQPSVFTRRDLSGYMHQVFGQDLDKELRRQAAYEPFFEALPNTPLPSAMISTSSTALAAVPPSINATAPPAYDYQRPSPDSNPGSYISGVSQPDHPSAHNGATSHSGPHPHPSVGGLSPAMASPTQPPAAFTPSNPTASMTPPVVRSQPAASPPTIQGGVEFHPGGYYNRPPQAPPAAPPPSFMFGDDDYDEEDDDDPTVLEGLTGRKIKKPSSPDTILNADDVPTRQLSYEEGLAAVQAKAPMPPPAPIPSSNPIMSPPTQAVPMPPGFGPAPTHGTPMTSPLMAAQPPTQAIQQPQFPHPNEDVLQPLGQQAPMAPPAPPAPAYTPPIEQASAPTMGIEAFEDVFEDDGSDTMMQQAMVSKKKPQKPASGGKSLVLVFMMIALLLAGGLAGAYFYRCKLFNVCPTVESTYYTLVFATSANGADVFLNGKQIPPHKLKFIGSNKIRLSFSKGGTYMLEIRKSGCQPLKDRIRVIKDMEVETPRLPLKCQ